MKKLWLKFFPVRYEILIIQTLLDYSGSENYYVTVIDRKLNAEKFYIGRGLTWNEYTYGVVPPIILTIKLWLSTHNL